MHKVAKQLIITNLRGFASLTDTKTSLDASCQGEKHVIVIDGR